MDIIKLDDGTFQVSEKQPQEVIITNFSYDDLLSERNLLKKKLDDLERLLGEAEKLGTTLKVNK